MINPTMSNNEFNRMSNFIYTNYGIKMPPIKKTMLESRLQKRLNTLSISSFKDYFDFVLSVNGQQSELINMIDVVTTNKTDFFREPGHFDFLTGQVLPEWIKKNGIR